MERKNIFANEKSLGKKLTYYIVLGVCVVVIGAASFLSYKSIQNALNKEKTQQVPETTNTQVEDVQVVQDEKEDTVVETQKVQESEQKNQPVAESKSYVMPVKGEITTGFSLETPVYSSTLGDWRIHDGVDISADLGTNVVAVNDGVVEKIESDDLMGITVTIKHTDGKKSCYSNLADSVELEQGQIINRGDIVGTVGNTAIYEISDGPHLHFEMSENGEKIDPTSVIK